MSGAKGRKRMRSAVAVLAGGGAVLVLAACGSSSSGGGSPAEQAASMPGSRQVIIPTDREVTLVVPQCPADTGATTEEQQQATTPDVETEVPSGEDAGTLEGANRLVLPKNSGVHTVLISACTSGSSQQSGGSSGGSSGGGGSQQMQPPSPGPNTITITPGAEGTSAERSAKALPGVGQVTLPEGSDANTVIVPACTGTPPQQSGGSSGGSSGGGAPTSNVVLPAESEGGRVRAPECTVPQPSSGG